MTKVKFIRGKESREFKQSAIERFSTEAKPWPESEGWTKVPVEVASASVNNGLPDVEQKPIDEKPVDEKPVDEKAAPADTKEVKSESAEDPGAGKTEQEEKADEGSSSSTADAENADGCEKKEPPAELKSSAECKCTPEDLDRIEVALEGKSRDDVAKFFENETRVTMNNLRDLILEKIPA